MQKDKRNLTLDKLPLKKSCFIESVNCEDKILRKHILNMGLTPGTEVTLLKIAPLGDPLELRVRGYVLSLRKADAKKIKITEIHDINDCPLKNTNIMSNEHPMIGEYENDKPRKNKPRQIKGDIKIALIGNQNSGKTTLFNHLTGSNQRVGNFPGVTVDRTDGVVKNYSKMIITDLPGIYSLSPYSSEEIVTRNFILDEKPDGIINIVDATNIERNFLLTLQLIELNVPMVIALNMMDEINANGGSIDINRLENTLGVPVVPISASKNEGIEELVEHVINVVKYDEHPKRLDFCDQNDAKQEYIHRCIHSIIHLIDDHAKAINIPTRFMATKLAEGDDLVLKALNLDKNEKDTIEHIISEMEAGRKLDRDAALADMRFSFIENLCRNFVHKPDETKGYKLSSRIDKILTGKYTAIVTFFAIMSLIFYITFGPVGTFFSDIVENIISYVTNIADSALSTFGLNKIVHSLIIDGIFAGVGAVLSFMPIIVILFFFLSILEDTGYMARVAFIMDKAFRKIGLSGRSFVPMLIGFGCSVPAIMATRTLPSERDRKITILLTPFMSCSAKLPIYALFSAAFFSHNQVLVVLGLYLIGIIVGILFAFILKLFVYKGAPVPFVMELPVYRMPSIQNIYRLIYIKSKDFITKAFTIIFWAAIIIWFLSSFDIRLNYVTNSANSMLAIIGMLLTPIFAPLGMDDWRIATAFSTGFMAKESVISTLTVLLGGEADKIKEIFTPLTAFVFLVFSLLYTPCVAAIATVKRELGKKYAFLVVFLQCSIAWLVSYIVYLVGLTLL